MTNTPQGFDLEGFGRRAGTGAHAEGNLTLAPGSFAHAEGDQTGANGTASHAEGISTTATGAASHTEGSLSTASGAGAHAEGQSSVATGIGSHAENYGTANGRYSHAGGYQGKAEGWSAWARGGTTYGLNLIKGGVAIYTLGTSTATTNATSLTFDGGVLAITTTDTSINNVLVVPMYSSFVFELSLSARRWSTGVTSQGWLYAGMIARDAGSARLVGAPTSLGTWSDGTALGTVSFTAQPTYLDIKIAPSSSALTIFLGTLKVTEIVTPAP